MASRVPRHVCRLAVAVACALVVVGGCQRKGIEDLVGSDLFSLSLGKLEDQVDLFQFPDQMTQPSTRIFMRDGWFYVANGAAGKVMVFSSYGDLLFLLYNPQMNPAPVSLAAVDPRATEETTRGAVAYPFADIGEIAVAADRTLYVEDAAPEAKAVHDTARGLVLDRIVLRFDRRGRALGWLGQEGIGGTPFPYISSLSVTANDQLVVVCRLPDFSWEIYWFSRDATLLWKTIIDADHMPVLPKAGSNPVLLSVMPDPRAPQLLLQVITYATSDASAQSSEAPDAVASRIYRLDLPSRRYDSRSLELPRIAPRRERVQLKTVDVPSPPGDFLGVSVSGMYYLMEATDTNLYTLQVVDAAGRVRATRRVAMEDSALTFRDVHLSADGLLYGLFADTTRARVEWWRSDLLAGGSAP